MEQIYCFTTKGYKMENALDEINADLLNGWIVKEIKTEASKEEILVVVVLQKRIENNQ